MRVSHPFLVDADGNGSPIEPVPITLNGKTGVDEAWLQRFIHQHPTFLPIGEIEPGLDAFSAICREMPIAGRGSVDNLLLTGRGDVAIVEMKLFRNPETRRRVLAQALDYATGLFTMGYESFEKAALKGAFAPREAPSSLYAAVPDTDKLPEAQFIDTVSRNLRQGRALILIVGDGIREEAERLLDGLRDHGRSGFTLALVELGVFCLPNSRGLIVVPAVVARTSIVQRTIVQVREGRATTIETETLAAAETLSADAIWDALGARVPGARPALEAFIREIEAVGVYPDFLRSLNFKWDGFGAKPVNLGYISKRGAVWTDLSAATGPGDLAHRYVQEVASAFDCDVHTMPTSGNWTPYQDGKPLRLAEIVDKLDRWVDPMRRFVAALGNHQSNMSSS